MTMTDDNIGGVKQNSDYNREYTLKDPDHDEIKDGYQLRWVGKNYAKLQENLRPETVIVPDAEHNAKAVNKDSQNLFLTGDNLEVLKHLEHSYTGKVDMIYIDPPYNTGSDGFVYSDNFRFTDDQLRDTLGLTEAEVKKIRNIYGKASHSAWLTFMYPRLKVAKKLLNDSGVFLVSINDNEASNLKLLLDEIFGEQGFVAQVPWRKRTAKSDVPYGVSQDYEWVFVYAKKDFLAGTSTTRKYYKTDDFPDDRWRLSDLTTQQDAQARPNSAFDLINPKNGTMYKYNPNRTWAVTTETFQDYYDKGKIVFPGDYDFLKITIPAYRVFESEDRAKSLKKYGTEDSRKAVSTFLPKEVGMSEDGNQDMIELFGSKIFSYPKPVSLISYLIEKFTHEKALIVDFFSGSSTTAHAVMKLNVKGSDENRRYIMCTLDEPVKKDSEAERAGYKTVDQIARKRIELAAKQLGDTTGFRHFRFATPKETTLEKVEDFDPTTQTLVADDMLTPFSEKSLTGNGVDSNGVSTILTTWLVDDGYDFNTKAEELDLAGYKAHYAKDIARLYLIDNKGWSKESCKQLLNGLGKNEIAVNAIVIYAYSFNFVDLTELKNNLKANLDKTPQIIERY
ncbi:site-specific DNA-methyltransferase [Candidatus Saccharibacteria bacterium]|nr:site-specific DNA-methyltransferase [Candidatus Saccharibacteria bacterium]NCU38438.1 site-specific DNA-methyltransferase [Candidatus Saccharibacteria bacterium]